MNLSQRIQVFNGIQTQFIQRDMEIYQNSSENIDTITPRTTTLGFNPVIVQSLCS